MRGSSLRLLLALTLALTAAATEAQTCANRKLDLTVRYRGKAQVSVPVQGLPTYVQNGITGAGEIWANGCQQQSIPGYSVDPAAPPPAPDSYDATQVLEIRFEDREPTWDTETNSWFAAEYNPEGGNSAIVLPKRCPPDQGGKTFPFCNSARTLITWGSQHGQRVIAHEMGHSLGLDHDTCATDSLMALETLATAKLRTEHCELADALNCDPANPPEGGCPQAADAVPFSVQVTGITTGTTGLPETLIVTRHLKDDKGIDQGQQDLSAKMDGELSFPDILRGWSYSLELFTTNPNKTCSANPTSGSNASSAVSVTVLCVCDTANINFSPAVGAATTDCPFFPPAVSKFELFAPVVPTFGNPWWGGGFGPGSNPLGEPCERQTVCVDGPEELVTLDDGTTILSQTLNCTDMCVNQGSAPVLAGPSTKVELPNGTDATDGTLLVQGWAVDKDGLEAVVFYVDGQKVTLNNYQQSLARPEACSQVQGQNAVNCNPNSGFSGTLDATTLSAGTHTLQVIPVDAKPSYPVATLVERTFSVPSCFDTTKPTTSVTSPANGAVVNGTVIVQAAASDNEGILRVDFLVDGVKRASDFAAPFTFAWDTTAFAEGSHTVRSRAIDHCNNSSVSALNTVTVDNIPPPPTITGNPISQTVAAGGSALFSVSASGAGTLVYQWQRNSVNLSNGGHFSGVTSPTLTVSSVDGTVTGSYRCLVSNAGGVVASNSATLSLAPCTSNTTTLCLQNSRFSTKVTIGSSAGRAIPYTTVGGFFWLNEPETVEVGVKVVDGRAVNGKFWVFHGSLTSLPYTLTVTDTTSGITKSYTKASGSFCGGADTSTFAALLSSPLGLSGGELPPGWERTPFGAAIATCTQTSTAVCLLDGRFRVEVLKGGLPQGAVKLTNKTGTYWFGSSITPEVVVKVLDGTPVNGRYWVFYGSLTNQTYQVRVTDTLSGLSKTYASPAAHCGEADTAAF